MTAVQQVGEKVGEKVGERLTVIL